MRRLFCALWILAVAGCSKETGGTTAASSPAAATPTPAPPAKLLVMATIAPMYCFTKNVAGDLADVEMIVPPTSNGGTFQPSPGQVRHILQADMVVENGFGFEKWMDALVAAGLRQGEERVLAARGTGPGIPGLPGDPNSPPSDAPPDFSGSPDPHVWLDPVMAIKEVQNIRDALMARDPAHADQYLANENRYEASLRDLDDEIGRMTVDIPNRKVVCLGKEFTYFLSRYEFTVDRVVQSPAGLSPADFLLVPAGAAVPKSPRVIVLNPMESGPASTDFYEQETLANVQALRDGL